MVETVYAIVGVPKRLAEAEKMGAIPISLDDQPAEKTRSATEGRGAEAVVEVVAHSDALMLALDMVKPYGKISSIGVHTDMLHLPGLQLYVSTVRERELLSHIFSFYERTIIIPI